MINYKELLESNKLVSELASTLDCVLIEDDSVIMMKKGEFIHINSSIQNIATRKAQGWIECVSTDTLHILFGENYEVVGDGTKEAQIIANWMREQK